MRTSLYINSLHPSRANYSAFFFNSTAPTDIYTLSLHDALPICNPRRAVHARHARHAAHRRHRARVPPPMSSMTSVRSEEHTSELQSHSDLVCRLLLEKKKLLSCFLSLTIAPSIRPLSYSETHRF